MIISKWKELKLNSYWEHKVDSIFYLMSHLTKLTLRNGKSYMIQTSTTSFQITLLLLQYGSQTTLPHKRLWNNAELLIHLLVTMRREKSLVNWTLEAFSSMHGPRKDSVKHFQMKIWWLSSRRDLREIYHLNTLILYFYSQSQHKNELNEGLIC